MTTLDLRPAPGAAPATRRILRHTWTETSLLLRNGEQLLLALVIPLAVLLGGYLAGDRLGIPMDQLAPSVLAMAIWSTAFASCAISTGFDRRYQVLERLAASPLGRTGLIIGKAAAIVLVVAGQLVVLGVFALVLGWRPVPSIAWLTVLPATLLAVVGFVAFALVLAGMVRAEITLALANLIYLAGLFAGILPIGGSGWLTATGFLPTGALGEVLRGASDGRADWIGLLVLAGWAVVATLIARKVFRWTS